MLVRRRLLERLRARWYVPVTVVSAPAGYGKTTLLSQAMAANAMAPLGVDCWLACEPDDATASSLGEGLAQAVGAVPSRAANAAAGQEAESRPALAGAVSEAMWRRSPQQVALVIDDVHEIPAGSEAAALLASIVDALPANGHIVLAGRGPPPVPLARLDVEGRAARLDEADLAFTEDEVAEFATLRGVPVARVATCGGWPALAELSATARSGVAADYVGQEVLAGLPATRRRDLALLAHLGPFDDELARAAIGPDLDVPGLVAGLPLVTADARWRAVAACAVAIVAGRTRSPRPRWPTPAAGLLRHIGPGAERPPPPAC